MPEKVATSPPLYRAGIEPANIVPRSSFCGQYANHRVEWAWHSAGL